MKLSSDIEGRRAGIVDLFRSAFSASEGAEEGALVGRLAEDLMTTTDPADLAVFLALEGDDIIGCIMFTRLAYERDDRTVFLLAPVAVATSHQGRGVGQALLRHGLSDMAARGVDVAITYGDPVYYAQVGFHPIAARDAAPPLPLCRPHGWLGQSLTDAGLAPLEGPSRCVAALNDPAYW